MLVGGLLAAVGMLAAACSGGGASAPTPDSTATPAPIPTPTTASCPTPEHMTALTPAAPSAYPEAGIYATNLEDGGVARLTSGPDFEPLWCPDGSLIAFYRGRVGDWDLWVMNSDGSSAGITKELGSVEYRDLSSDWHLIAYSVLNCDRQSYFDTYLAALDGSTEPILVEDAKTPRWSPNGSDLAVVRGDSIYRWSEGEGDDELLLLASPGQGGYSWQSVFGHSWSPDGAWIAFVVLTPDEAVGQLLVVRNDGSAIRQLAQITTTGIGQPVWTPDAKKIAFSVENETDEWLIYVVDTEAGSILWHVKGENPSWSQDSQQLAFVRHPNLYVVDSNGANLRRLTDFAELSATIESPEWAPDDTSISFALSPSIAHGIPCPED